MIHVSVTGTGTRRVCEGEGSVRPLPPRWGLLTPIPPVSRLRLFSSEPTRPPPPSRSACVTLRAICRFTSLHRPRLSQFRVHSSQLNPRRSHIYHNDTLTHQSRPPLTATSPPLPPPDSGPERVKLSRPCSLPGSIL